MEAKKKKKVFVFQAGFFNPFCLKVIHKNTCEIMIAESSASYFPLNIALSTIELPVV